MQVTFCFRCILYIKTGILCRVKKIMGKSLLYWSYCEEDGHGL